MKRIILSFIGLFLATLGPSSVWADGVLTPAANPTLSLPRAWGVSVDEEGAAGNGTADDTLAIRRAITKSGVGGTVVLSPNATYLVSNTLQLLTGQTLEGRGATIKRAPQITTTTTASITTGGSTTVTVSNAAVFAVGDLITFSVEDHAATPATNHYSSAVAITNIVSNTLTLANALTIGQSSTGDVESVIAGGTNETTYTFLSGATVARVYPLISTPSGGTITNLVIDGNWKSIGGTVLQPVAHWDLFAEILVKNQNADIADVTVRHVTITNFSSEAILESGSSTVTGVYAPASSTSARYLDLTVTEGAGNAIHTSGINNVIVEGLHCTNINQYFGVGHYGGCIAMSFTGASIIVTRSYMDRAYAGLSNANLGGHGRLVFTNNIVKNTFRAGFESNGTSATASMSPQSLIVTGNHFVNARLIVFRSQQATNTGLLDGVIFEGNTLSGTQVLVEFAKRVNVAHNIIRNDFVVPSLVSASRSYTDTTAVVASGTNYYIGQKVYFAKSGSPMVRSRTLAVSNVAGTTITFATAIGTSSADNIPANAYLYDADRIPVIQNASGSITTGDLTLTVPDASPFIVNQWLVVSAVSVGTQTTAAHIKSINYTTNVITLGTTLDRTYTSTSLNIWPIGFSPDATESVTLNTTGASITQNTIVGGLTGAILNNDCSGTKIVGNVLTGQRGYGVRSSTTATAIERIEDNTIDASSTYSASWWQGIYVQSKAEVFQNRITTTGAGQNGIYVAAGTNAIIDRNVLRGSSTNPLQLIAGATSPHLGVNFFAGTAGVTDASTAPMYGVATITAASTTVTVTHNLGYAPNSTDLLVTPTLLSLSKSWWVSGITSTQFTINVDVAPGAGTATFAWKIVR